MWSTTQQYWYKYLKVASSIYVFSFHCACLHRNRGQGKLQWRGNETFTGMWTEQRPRCFSHFFVLLSTLNRITWNAIWKKRTDLCVLTHAFLFCTVPKMQFKERVYTCSENDARVAAVISRSGDVQHRSSVRCYTRQASAQVMMDFDERPNTDASIVTFLPGMCELGNVLNLLLICWFGVYEHGGGGVCTPQLTWSQKTSFRS